MDSLRAWREKLRTPVVRNAGYLIATEAVSAILGLAFWSVAARLFPDDHVLGLARSRAGGDFGGVGLGLLGLLLLLLHRDNLGLLRTSIDDALGHFFIEADFFHQRTGADFLDVANIDQAQSHNLVHVYLDNAFDALEGLVEALHAGLEFRRRENVDVPAGKPGRQSHVLSTLANGEGELVIVNNDGGAA